MNISDEETEALARQLWALYAETLGYMASAETGWEDLSSPEKTGWVTVAQAIDAGFVPKDEPDHC